MKIILSVLSITGLLLFAGCQNTPQTEERVHEMEKSTEAYQQSLNQGSGSVNAPADANPQGIQNDVGN
ncbi:hypothetical protein [Ruficoccus sp. ZRK36]|uniref:hypothetical protein n=1 Tax=Ruficoccus sp. ZRK36 TaxID=2866311 RepID=UPI001C730892|nr:hypothetical protein [Ruficoccus sp. ZRK36]QYY34550.1 hypothetical protein K0V07_09560 [Ruficoccus sp. ZRK36]